MCLAIPALVTQIHKESDSATINLDGICKQISLALVEDVQIGDYLLVHVGYALNKISPKEAEATLKLFAEAGLLSQPDNSAETDQ